MADNEVKLNGAVVVTIGIVVLIIFFLISFSPVIFLCCQWCILHILPFMIMPILF